MQFILHGALQYNELGVFMAFEETSGELTKNFASLGFDLDDLVADPMSNFTRAGSLSETRAIWSASAR
jgi:hypothetical protein